MASVRTVRFEVEGERVEAEVHLPDALPDAGKAPVVVMAHGFGLDRFAGLDRYIEPFVDRGLAVLCFDHRGFGTSAGDRQLVDPFRHRSDWLAAVDRARALEGVDGERVALWGTSFSGGHALEAAARREVAGVVAQVPFIDGVATLGHLLREQGAGYVLRAVGEGLRDLVQAAIGRDPHEVPIVGPPDRFALLNSPGAEAGYRRLVDPDSGWRNAAPARVSLLVPVYRPIRRAGEIACPVHVTVASEDEVLPASASRRLVQRLPAGELLEVEAGHFEVYEPPLVADLVEAQGAFLERVLG